MIAPAKRGKQRYHGVVCHTLWHARGTGVLLPPLPTWYSSILTFREPTMLPDRNRPWRVGCCLAQRPGSENVSSNRLLCSSYSPVTAGSLPLKAAVRATPLISHRTLAYMGVVSLFMVCYFCIMLTRLPFQPNLKVLTTISVRYVSQVVQY